MFMHHGRPDILWSHGSSDRHHMLHLSPLSLNLDGIRVYVPLKGRKRVSAHKPALLRICHLRLEARPDVPIEDLFREMAGDDVAAL